MPTPKRFSIRLALPVALGLLAGHLATVGCESAYYGAWEKLGHHKRDILVDRVEDGRDEQEAAKEEFQNALEEFTAVVGFEGGDLQTQYDRLSGALDDCEDRAEAVTDRIESIESVAEALFEEWETELEQYTNADLRRKSELQLRSTQGRYSELIGAMRKAESKMAPVLTAFQDQVLFLKHNLNAQAIASLQGEVASLEATIAALVTEMEAAIAEANSFIDSMGQS